MEIHGPDYSTHYTTNIFINANIDIWKINDWKKQLVPLTEPISFGVDKLKLLIQFVVAAIAPAKIYILQQRGDSTSSTASAIEYINLLIVMPGDYKGSAESGPVLEMSYLEDQRASCFMYSEEAVLAGLRNGHVFYSLNCIPSNLAYDNKVRDYPIPIAEILQDLKQQAWEKFIPVYEKALDFHESAAYLCDNLQLSIVPFLLHQAAEFTYRAILQGLDLYGKITHDIRTLQKLARQCIPQLNIVFPDNTDEEKGLLDLLEHAYSDARYANGYFMREDKLSALFERVFLLQEMVKRIMKEKLE